MTLWSLGLVRGVVGQIVGFAAGMALVIASRLLFGFDPSGTKSRRWWAASSSALSAS